jgi:putative heme-binding domain-containing protein
MDDNNANSDRPRYVWPRFVLAGLVLGVVLVVVWMSVAVRQVRERRESNPWASPPGSRIENANGPTNIQSTNVLLAGFQDVLAVGDAAAGRKIFFEKPEANCAKCHKVGGQGGEQGPPLDGVGARRSREFILEAILYPNLHAMTNYETVIVLLKNGTARSGILKSEDATNLVVNTPEDELVTISKGDVQLRQKGLSPMPEGLGQILSRQDLRDLVEYVQSLQK